MKRITIILFAFLVSRQVFSDIAPNPIIIKGIYTIDNCRIQMVSEYVSADLYNDSAKIECTFELLNSGDSATIQIGFPEMNFQYWSIGQYNENDETAFRISVNDRILTENEIGVPKELENVYNTYKYIYFIEKEYDRKTDSIYKANNVIIKANGTAKYTSNQLYQETKKALDELNEWRDTKPQFGSDLWMEFDKQMGKGNFPWYVWNVHFAKNERKVIKVAYSLPSCMGYGAEYRYFKYILETGSGWNGVIEKANIKLKVHNIKIKTIEEITPNGFHIDRANKTIEWNLENLEPTNKDDIYIKYYDPKERRKWQKNHKKKSKKM